MASPPITSTLDHYEKQLAEESRATTGISQQGNPFPSHPLRSHARRQLAAHSDADTASEKEDEDEENRVVETDNTGRFARYRKSLGRGAYKDVFKAFDEEEGKEVAWNQLRVDHLNKRDAQRVLSEIAILQSLRNNYIINLLHHWVAKGRDGRERVFFITELMTSGTLKTFLKKSKGPIKPKVLRSYCRQILLGLEYLHSRNPPIIHRDLKCENIFVNGFNGQVKVGDLGLAIVKNKDHASSVLGTAEFMAPELYDENYDEKVDIYAFGMVVIEIVTKEYPYSECTNQAQIYKKVTSRIKPLALQKVTDEETRNFIDLCIRFNPAERPSATELLASPFLNSPIPASMDSGLDSTFSEGRSSMSDAPAIPMDDAGNTMGRGGSASGRPMMAEFNATPPLPMSFQPTAPIRANLDMASAGRTTSKNASLQSTPLNSDTESDRSRREGGEVSPAEFDAKAAESHQFVPAPHANHVAHSLHTAGAHFSTNPTLSLPLPNPASSSVIVEMVERTSEHVVVLKMIYGVPGKEKAQEIRFPFNLPDDTATDVVAEMVKEKLIEARDEQLARRKLEEKVKSILLGKVEQSTRRPSDGPSPTNLHHPGVNSGIPSPTRTSMSQLDSHYESDARPDAGSNTVPRSRQSTSDLPMQANNKFNTMPRTVAHSASMPASFLSSSPQTIGRQFPPPALGYSQMSRRDSSPPAPHRNSLPSSPTMDLPPSSGSPSPPPGHGPIVDPSLTHSRQESAPSMFSPSLQVPSGGSMSVGASPISGTPAFPGLTSEWPPTKEGQSSHSAPPSLNLPSAWSGLDASGVQLPLQSIGLDRLERSSSATSVSSSASLASTISQNSVSGASLTSGGILAPGAQNLVRQQFLDLQERSLKDLGTRPNGGFPPGVGMSQMGQPMVKPGVSGHLWVNPGKPGAAPPVGSNPVVVNGGMVGNGAAKPLVLPKPGGPPLPLPGGVPAPTIFPPNALPTQRTPSPPTNGMTAPSLQSIPATNRPPNLSGSSAATTSPTGSVAYPSLPQPPTHHRTRSASSQNQRTSFEIGGQVQQPAAVPPGRLSSGPSVLTSGDIDELLG